MLLLRTTKPNTLTERKVQLSKLLISSCLHILLSRSCDNRVCFWLSVFLYCAPTVGKGAINVAFVRPQVRLSVRPSRTEWIIREPEGIACPNLERRFPIIDATRTPVSRSIGQRSRSPGPLMLTHIVRHILRMRTYRTPLVVVVWRISRSFPYQFAPNSHAVF